MRRCRVGLVLLEVDARGVRIAPLTVIQVEGVTATTFLCRSRSHGGMGEGSLVRSLMMRNP